MFKDLMTSRRFAPLFWCQLCSALNDNFLKNALAMLILFGLGGAGGAAAEYGGLLITVSGIVFIAPFFILSALGGELADRYDKAFVARHIRLAEIPIAALAAAGFFLHSVPVLFAALALFGVVASLFGPVKYGILPEKLQTAELPAGNALVEGATFLAILVGTIAGGVAVASAGRAEVVVLIILVLALASWTFARMIPAAGPAAPELKITANPWTSTMALLRELNTSQKLWGGAQIVSWFWLVGFVTLSLLPALIKTLMGGSEGVVTACLAVFTVGIAIGSTLAARASHGQPNLGLVPLGALLMGVFSLGVAWIASNLTPSPHPMAPAELLGSPSGLSLLACLCGLAIAGGLFIVPSFAAVQAWAPVERRARVIAAVNVLNAAYMLGAGAVVAGLQAAGVGVPVLFAALGLLTITAIAYIVRAWGSEVMRDAGRTIFRFFFRLEVAGLENIPGPGERVVLAPNHVSLLDGPLLHTILPKQAGFAVNNQIAQAWWVRPFLTVIKAHLLEPTKPLAARALVNTVKAGEPIVIFPEGRITVTGGLMKAYDGAGMIVDKADAWLVPVRIEGPERSPFGYLRRTQTRKSLFPKFKVTFLPPRRLALDPALKGKARRQSAGLALQDMLVDTAVETARFDRTLFAALADARRTRDTGRPAVSDPLGTELSYRKLILGSQVLGAKLEPLAPVGGAVGLMLPNSAGVAVAFFALQSIGRVPAMINFTSGAANIRAACHAARVCAIVTSRAFIDKARLGPLVADLERGLRIVYLEDVRQTVGLGDKLAGLLAGARQRVARNPADPAVILFTSGSEGVPKGVVLSHSNILANCAQCLSRLAANGEDLVFNVLPVFHSFGLTGGLMMPLIGGVPVYLYPSPLHYRIVPELVYDTGATIFFGTDTFLRGYARTAHPYDFRSVRLVVAGAEAVKDSTRQIYMDRFGVRVLEGYGVTETAPVLAMNTPIANKAGTVGRLSPLMQARLEPVAGIAEGGRLFVSGPNVMLGYFRAENPGVLEIPKDGWHDTGDIVAIDGQGFITIKGRVKRFAKIAGEMVSLAAVEALASEASPGAALMVVSLPDPRKGERLALLTTDRGLRRDTLQRHARSRGAAELMVPSDIVHVDSLPLLGSGKPDYVAAAALATDKVTAAPQKQEAAGEAVA
ncbi:MAG TPA: acyl-[ACP]--phospholipid O-acyltransferase [Hyphomicrobiaceae bacterium]|nr:acyl-[ACP]--phospholipid O-acyltransferase [Hyphomicrobiaceae bacterium]